MFTKLLAAGVGLAALAATAPAAAQYSYGYGYQNPYGQQQYGYSRYGYNPYAQQQYGYSRYGYANPYGSQYGYGYGHQSSYASQMAVSRCQAAVQYKLQNRNTMASILGVLLGAGTPSGRVVGISQVYPRSSSTIRVRGLASSGRFAGYSPYGVGAYGASGYGYQPDLAFTCDVDYRGYVRDVDFDRLR